MKLFITSILIALLTACGSCEPESVVVTEVIAPTQVAQPASEPSTPVTDPVVAPVPVKCSDVITENCYVEICPFSTEGTSSCPPSPYTPRHPLPSDPPTTPVCVRDTTPLVFVDPFWVDNCGNKYGQTTI